MYSIQELGKLRFLAGATLTDCKWRIVAAALLHAWHLGAHRRSIDKSARVPLRKWLKRYFSDDTARRIASAVWKRAPELGVFCAQAQHERTPDGSIDNLVQALKGHFGSNLVAFYQPDKFLSDEVRLENAT